MRITNNMLSRNLLRNLEAAKGRMDELQNQMSTGHRISRPSDDPVGIENALRLKTNIAMVNQWSNNASEALGNMNTTDSIMGEMTSMLQRVRELAVQGANDTTPPDARKGIAQEVRQLAEQLRVVANTKIGTKYIFAGTKTDQEPMPTPSSSWQGNFDPVNFQVGNNVTVNITVDGQDLFTNETGGTVNGQGIFANSSYSGVLDDLSNALETNDTVAIGATLDDIDSNIDKVQQLRAGLGARINRMNAIRDQLDATTYNLEKNLSDIQDADMAKAIVDFKNQENVFRSALAVGAQIIQPSLVDFLK
ncbi:flagellar hook-associated protein FlgL [Paradesulfitobacterium ferrireducens]|uniref:flagellar hook-associated protein FlgL n=1 Tax=Paradesulfitobacterium ferrireducens TaxID=2816476 RepID=UPI001A8EEA9E|nr:flagellar hook-associated protein FlgL [Paradesulfitobacterium ferrireducens]